MLKSTKGLLDLSYSSTFHIAECDFFISLQALLQKEYDKPFNWHDLCYVSNDDYDEVNFTSNDPDLAEFIQNRFTDEDGNNGGHVVAEVFNVDTDRFKITISEIFIEEYDNLFFKIKIFEKWEDENE